MSKIYNFCHKHAITILVVAILLYIAIFFGISYWKYDNFLYNSFDLAIFNQVFYNTSHGRLLQLSIHEPTYLGDHFAPIILILSLFYSFYRSPLTLLFLQTAILALSAWPIYLIAKKVTKGNVWPLIISLAWLINPLVQNANLFEFHLLPFAVFFLFWVFYFYLQRKWFLFFLFTFLSLLVREDVSLVIFGMGILIIIEGFVEVRRQRTEKRKLQTINYQIQNFQKLIIGTVLCLVSIFWLFASLKIIGHYAPAGNYKFLYYYSWLGSSISEIIINIFSHPLKVLKHLITLNNLEMLLGLLLSFVFLPLWSKRYLILLLGPLLQLMIGASGGSALILQTHYNLLLLPALVISTIYGLKYFLSKPVGQDSRFEIIKILTKEKKFLLIIFILGIIYGNLSMGPLGRIIYRTAQEPLDQERIKIKKYFLEKIPPRASVAATSEYLNNLSSRQRVYSMHYAFIGKRQYSEVDYKLPLNTEYLLVDFNDFFNYQIQLPGIPAYAHYFNSADENIRGLLENYELIELIDDYALFYKNTKLVPYRDTGIPSLSHTAIREHKNRLQLYQLTDKKPKHEESIELEDKIKFLGWEINQIQNSKFKNQKSNIQYLVFNIPLSLFWRAQTNLSNNYQLKMLITDNKKEVVYEKFYPLGYNILPTSEWPTDKAVQTNYWFYIPQEFTNPNNILQFELVQVEGYLKLNEWRQAVPEYKERPLRPMIVIGKIEDLK
jgi:uncharacterized membrane protein